MKVEDPEWWPHLRSLLERHLEQVARPVRPHLVRDGRLLLQACKEKDKKRGRISKQLRARSPAVSPDDFRGTYKRLIGLGGKLWGVEVVFGFDPDSRRMGDHSRIWFKPTLGGKMSVGWTLRAWNDCLKAQLNRSNRGLWNHESNCPGVEFQIVEAGAEVVARLRAINIALSEGKEGEQQEHMPTLWELQWVLGSLLDYCRTEKDAHRLNLAMKVYLDFKNDISQSEPDQAIHESPYVRRMKAETLSLASLRQRPPTMGELRQAIDWRGGLKEFKEKLSDAGLTWLPTERTFGEILAR